MEGRNNFIPFIILWHEGDIVAVKKRPGRIMAFSCPATPSESSHHTTFMSASGRYCRSYFSKGCRIAAVAMMNDDMERHQHFYHVTVANFVKFIEQLP